VGCGSESWYGSHGREPWALNESTKMLGAAYGKIGFEGPTPLEEEEKKKKHLEFEDQATSKSKRKKRNYAIFSILEAQLQTCIYKLRRGQEPDKY